MSKKKNKKAIAKKSAKAQQRKKQKRKVRLVKTKQQSKTPQYFDQLPMAAVDAPSGYRAVSISQAIMEYSKSITNFEEAGDVEDMNSMFQFTSLLWNYAITRESGDVDRELTKEILGMIQPLWQVDEEKAQSLLDKFVAKKNELFPPEVQVKGSSTMFMRKQIPHLIAPFNYNQFELTDDIIPPDDSDRNFLQKLEAIEGYIQDEKDYGSWEDEFFEMEKVCKECFSNWLINKGVPKKYSQEFPFLIEVFLSFVYRYFHEDIITINSIQPIYLDEFLFDHVLRKVMMEPHEHTEWIPALRLFYGFLDEKGYVDEASKFIKIFDDFERQFVEILRERYC